MKPVDPSVSVIIPCFNTGNFLAEALEGVINQTFTDWEAIVVDDGSTDNTKDVVARFEDHRVKYFYQDNQGLSAARNAGIRAAVSDYIALLDADDIWLDDYLEKMLIEVRNHPEAIALYCGFKYIDPQGNQIGVPQLRNLPPSQFPSVIIKQNWIVPSSVIFRKDVIDQAGYFDETLNAVEDWDMWIKMSEFGKFIGVPHHLVKYRLHNTNMSKDPRLMVSSHFALIEKRVGPPEGNPAEWTDLKTMFYRCYYGQSAERYLEYGDLNQGASFFWKMLEIAPENGLKMGVWRSLIRLHLPIEIRHAPGVVDWDEAEQEVYRLLQTMSDNDEFYLKQGEINLMKASAEVALAREAVEANEPKRAYFYIWSSAKSSFRIIGKRAFWGTLARAFPKSINLN